jgi:esterase/lipase superfamily enzyme
LAGGNWSLIWLTKLTASSTVLFIFQFPAIIGTRIALSSFVKKRNDTVWHVPLNNDLNYLSEIAAIPGKVFPSR